MQITKNFNISEFKCNCGCVMPDNVTLSVIKVAIELQKLRDYIGESIRINSAYRCPAHNKKIGGAKNSQHLLGKAADIRIKRVSPTVVADTIEFLISKGDMLQGGLGYYDNFTHYDIRKTKSRWDNRK